MNTTTKRVSMVIGVLMLVAMAGSVFAPLIRTEVRSHALDTPVPTLAPTQTLPPPPDTSTISFDQTFLHPSGLFTVAQPTGWVPGQPTNNGTQAQINMNNSAALSVIEAYVEVPASPVATADDLGAHFTTAMLNSGWRNYTTNREMARKVEGDKLLIDFELTLGRQNYLARHAAWTDGQWIYVIRVVTPENARDLLLFLLDKMIPTLKPNKEFAGTPTGWNGYFDPQDKHIIRYPANWTLEDSAPGKPASISGQNTVLRIESASGSIADEAAAQAWLENIRAGANVLSVKPVERDGFPGFSVAYSYKDADGENQNGLAVLLNGPDEKVHVANLRTAGPEIDLNSDNARTQYGDLTTVMSTFTLMPNLNPAIAPSAG